MAMRIIHPGLLSTVQDLGRHRYAHLGVTPAGAADSLSLRVANLLLGNDENTAAIEMTMVGITVEFERAAFVALAGADVECSLLHPGKPTTSLMGTPIGNAKAPMWRPFPVLPGSILKCGAVCGGARAYLAVQGGFRLKPVMGSTATLRSAHLGGVDGRPLMACDRLDINHVASPAGLRRLRPDMLAYLRPRRELRLTSGPQACWFGAAGLQTLQRSPYAVSADTDRRGVRFQGEALTLPPKSQLLTEGISLGAMQVPPDGQPIILFVDQQTTGGYPKIANVIAADLRHLAQLRPRDEVRFRVVALEEALGLLRKQEEWLKEALL